VARRVFRLCAHVNEIEIVGGGERLQSPHLIDAEQVLDWIPAWCFTGDPITGCLVRAGLSALIGQTLDCKKSTAELPWFKPRMKALGQCMVHHIPDMGVTAAARAARCVMRFGF